CQLLLIDTAGCIDHGVAAGIVLGEGDELAYVRPVPEERHPAIETEGTTSMRRRAELERVHEETELVSRIFIGESEHAEHRFLHRSVVYADASSADLCSVDHQIVRV